MTKLNQEQKQLLNKVILDSIQSEDTELKTDKDKLNYAWNRFKNEFGHEVKRQGLYKAFGDWLQGLALDIPFYNVDILKLAEQLGQPTKTEKQQDKILNDYWLFMANKILILMKRNKINIYEVV